MFDVNRVMALYDDDRIVLHLNGKEICTLYEVWDAIDALRDLFHKINKVLNGKPYKFFGYWIDDIGVSDEATDLLYSVQQFTQVEEKAFMEEDWETLDKLLLKRIEDGEIE